MNQISENLFTAIDIIVQQRIANLSYDKTNIGTIIDIISQNKYLVRIDTSSFFAYSEDNYAIGDQVYIITPENNDSEKKIILGRYIKDQNFLVSPNIEDNLILYAKEAVNTTLNNQQKIQVNLQDYFNLPTHWGFTGDITSSFANQEDGFEIIFDFCQNDIVISSYIFTKQDIMGIPSLLSESHQEKLFEINFTELINNIKISVNADSSLLNLMIQNMVLYFGDHIKNYKESGVYLRTVNQLSFSEVNEQKVIYASVLQKSNSGQIIKSNNEILLEEYIITSYLSEEMPFAWRAKETNSNGIFTIATNVEEYPYIKLRAKSNNLISETLTFNNKMLSPENMFDTTVVLGTEYQLIAEMINNDDLQGPRDVFTDISDNYTLQIRLVDKYSGVEIASWEDGELEPSITSLLNNTTIKDFNIKANSPYYDILYITCIYLGKKYTTYVPLGYRTQGNNIWDTFIGATIIKYDFNGINPSYNQEPYTILQKSQKIACSWELVTGDNNIQYIPSLKIGDGKVELMVNNNYIPLQDYNFYIKASLNTSDYWIFPIVITKEEGYLSTTDSVIKIEDIEPIVSSLTANEQGLNGLILGKQKKTNQEDSYGLFLFKNNNLIDQLTNENSSLINNQITQINQNLLAVQQQTNNNTNDILEINNNFNEKVLEILKAQGLIQ